MLLLQDVAAAAMMSQLSALSAHVEQQLEQQAAFEVPNSSSSSSDTSCRDLLLQVLPLLRGAHTVLQQNRQRMRMLEQQLLALPAASELTQD